jgi:hypothetical protein
MVAIIFISGRAYLIGMCCTGDTDLIVTAAVAMITVTGLAMVTATSLACLPTEISMVVVADAVVKVTAMVTTCIGCCCHGGNPSCVSWSPSQILAWSYPHLVNEIYDHIHNHGHSCYCHHGHGHDLYLFL